MTFEVLSVTGRRIRKVRALRRAPTGRADGGEPAAPAAASPEANHDD